MTDEPTSVLKRKTDLVPERLVARVAADRLRADWGRLLRNNGQARIGLSANAGELHIQLLFDGARIELPAVKGADMETMRPVLECALMPAETEGDA